MTPPRARKLSSARPSRPASPAPAARPAQTTPPDDKARYLFRSGADEPFARTRGRRDFYLLSDGSLWAHESHDWLLAAGSGSVLAHRTGRSYYSVSGGECLFSERPWRTH